jgi:hypothetical protein
LRKVPGPSLALAASPLPLIALPTIAVLLVSPGLGFVYLLLPSSIHSPTILHLTLAVALGGLAWAVVFRLAFLVPKWFTVAGGMKREDSSPRP